MRIQNIYHLTARSYLLKMGRSGLKVNLLLESGVRLHPTQYARPKDKAPNSFATKLRKHMRGTSLQSVSMLGGGNDRVVDLAFGVGERQVRCALSCMVGQEFTRSMLSEFSRTKAH